MVWGGRCQARRHEGNREPSAKTEAVRRFDEKGDFGDLLPKMVVVAG